MKHWYKFLAFGVAIAMLAVLACGGDDDEEPGAVTAPPTAAPAPPASPAPAPRRVVVTRAPVAQQAPVTGLPAPRAVARPAPPPTVAPAAMIKKGGILRVSPNGTLGNLDHVRNTATAVFNSVNSYYDWPMAQNSDAEVKGQMVDVWTLSDDALHYSYTLRDGLLFHDGSPVEASDVVASIKRWQMGTQTPATITRLAGDPEIVAIDTKTFEINPTIPFGLWNAFWATGGVGGLTLVMPKEIAAPLKREDVMTEYGASGPMKFVSWNPGAKLTMERFVDYKPRSEPKSGTSGARIMHVDGIEVIEVPDPATRVAALFTRQVELVDGVDADFLEKLLDEPTINVSIIRPSSLPILATNKVTQPMNNPKARLALVHMINPREYLTAMFGDREGVVWDLCSSLYMCGTPWASDVGEEVYLAGGSPESVAKAKVLWKEAMEEEGWVGKKIVLLTNTDISYLYAGALITKRNLETLGADVEFVVMDWASLLNRKISNLREPPDEGGWHLYQSGGGMLDPVGDSTISQGWNGGFDNAEVQQLVLDFTKAKSYEEGKAIVDEIHRIHFFEDPAVPHFGVQNSITALQDYVNGFSSFRVYTLDGVWLSK